MLIIFNSTNSLIVTVDRTLTNILSLPFVARPARSTSTVFKALVVAQKTNVVTAKSSLSVSLEEIDQEINVNENNTMQKLQS